jgi:uncharacterized membrane protein YeaQ/YmgE (transglycosylase-associated protein family)
MSIIAWIVVGLIAGWLAHLIMGGRGGIVGDLILGIIGAIVGGFVMGLLTGYDYTTGINIPTILVSVLGAVIVLAIYRAINHERIRA